MPGEVLGSQAFHETEHFKMGTCSSCVWWTDITSQYEAENLYTHPKMQDEIRSPMPDRWGVCEKVDQLHPKHLATQFYVTDGSEYMAHLHTRETFGCNQHEER